jgi:uncharacterized repeat protein (TIGR03803 family)
MKTYFKYGIVASVVMTSCISCTIGSSPKTNDVDVLYSFQGNSDGAAPWATLLKAADGNLYGVTSSGGSHGSGVIYKISTNEWNYQKLMDMPANSDAIAALSQTGTNNPNMLYGVAKGGGANNDGFIFSYDLNNPSSDPITLHSFTPTDGIAPAGQLYWTNNKFYGTTKWGGNSGCTTPNGGGIAGCGTLFSFNPSNNNFNMLYAFDGTTYGGEPFGGFSQNLPESPNVLYTTTGYLGPTAHGAVISWDIIESGTPTLQYAFAGDNTNPIDGACGWHPPTFVNGVAYGATWAGGTADNGVIYKISPNQNLFNDEQVMYEFGTAPGASNPYSGLLLASDGNLYGTTFDGGSGDCPLNTIGNDSGCGTVYKVTPSGVMTVIANFDGKNGKYPRAGLVEVNGVLYGTTTEGGRYNNGVIFSLKLNP